MAWVHQQESCDKTILSLFLCCVTHLHNALGLTGCCNLGDDVPQHRSLAETELPEGKEAVVVEIGGGLEPIGGLTVRGIALTD